MIELAWYILIITLVCLIAWLSNREINLSIEQARKSERLMKDEREIFESIIRKRTDELMLSERMRIAELEKNAKFGELSQGLFHDLMNPLSSIALFIENMKSGLEYSKETKDMIDKTIAASKRMESFMNSIRHATAATTKATEYHADLALELSIVHDLLAYKARMAGIKIIIDKFDSFSIMINPLRLHQLLLNLISNALEACVASKKRFEQTGIEGIVKISALRDKEKVMIVIRDNGCGIPEDKIDEIFNHPFTTKSKGTGIGLMTVKKIISEELHGDISMESGEDEGTVCTITIPIIM